MPRIHALGALIAFIASAPHAPAQVEDPPAPPVAPAADPAPDAGPPQGPPDDRVSVSFSLASRLTFQAELRGPDTDVWVSRTGGDASVRIPAAERLNLTLTFRGEYARYDFEGDDLRVGVPADRFDDFYSTGLSALARYQIDDKWSIGAIAGVNADLETGAEFGDAITGVGILFAGYQASEDLFVGFGGGVATRLEDNVAFVPAFQVRWSLTENITFATTGAARGVAAIAGGVGAQLTVDLNESWTVGLFGAYESRQYRLDDEDPLLEDGVFRDVRVPLGLAVRYAPSRNIDLTLAGGAVLYQEFELLDADGQERVDLETDPAPFVGIRLTLRF